MDNFEAMFWTSIAMLAVAIVTILISAHLSNRDRHTIAELDRQLDQLEETAAKMRRQVVNIRTTKGETVSVSSGTLRTGRYMANGLVITMVDP